MCFSTEEFLWYIKEPDSVLLILQETLTGFKWMGNRADALLKEGKTVLFAFEEAIGFMCGSCVLDKDGVSAAAVCAEMATYVYNQGLTLSKQLEKIYQE